MKTQFNFPLLLVDTLLCLVFSFGSCHLKRQDPHIVPDSSLFFHLSFKESLRNEVDGVLPRTLIRDSSNTIENIKFVSNRQGQPRQAIYLNGNSFLAFQYFNKTSAFTNLSIAAWINLQSTTQKQSNFDICVIKDLSSEYIAKLTNDGVYGNEIYGSNNYYRLPVVSMSYPINKLVGNFRHVCVTFDSTVVTIYVNGIQQGIKKFPLGDTLSRVVDTPFILVGQGFRGVLDEVRIYRSTLSPQQVQRLMLF